MTAAALGLICHMQESLEWWKTAFGTEYFEIFETLFPEPTEMEVKFLMRFLPPGGRVLDLGCGAGRHSLAISKAGFSVTGIDRSREALELARTKAKEMKVAPTFIEDDMRTFNLEQVFDLVLLVGNVFGYGTDAEQSEILLHAASHMKKEGTLILALHNSLRTLGSLKDHGSREQTICIRDQDYQVKEEYRFDPLQLIKTSTWSVASDGSEVYRHDARVRFYVFPELKAVVEKAGMCIEQTFGSYKGEPFSASSPYLILICHKK